jgi:DNA-binding transcriptional LysR family regulator
VTRLFKAFEQPFNSTDLHCVENLVQSIFTLKQAVIFANVAKIHNQKRVAEMLCISPATVSRALKELEQALGIKLFEYSHLDNKLTNVGYVFLSYAELICQSLHDLLEAAEQQDKSMQLRKATRIKLQQINAFVAVGEAGGLGTAARAIQVAPSNLSRAIDDLEATLGWPIMERSCSGMSLTSVGRLVIPLAKKILKLYAQVGSAMALWKTQGNGKLSIIGSLAILPQVMPRLLSELKSEFPDHQVELRSDCSDRIEQAVSVDSSSLGLCVVVHEKPQFIYTHLLEAQLGVAWSPKLEWPASIRCLNDLRNVPFIRFGSNAVITEVLLAQQTDFEAYFNSSITVDSVQSGIDLVKSGKFAMLITGVGAGREAAPDLNFLPLPCLLPALKVSIIRHRDCQFDERQEHVKEALANAVLETPWHESVKLMRKVCRSHPRE